MSFVAQFAQVLLQYPCSMKSNVFPMGYPYSLLMDMAMSIGFGIAMLLQLHTSRLRHKSHILTRCFI